MPMISSVARPSHESTSTVMLDSSVLLNSAIHVSLSCMWSGVSGWGGCCSDIRETHQQRFFEEDRRELPYLCGTKGRVHNAPLVAMLLVFRDQHTRPDDTTQPVPRHFRLLVDRGLCEDMVERAGRTCACQDAVLSYMENVRIRTAGL